MDDQIKELLEYFQECMVDSARASGGLIGKTKASYPMVVVCLGRETMGTMGREVGRQLMNLWPAYKNALLFLGADICDGDTVYQDMSSGASLSADEVRDRAGELFVDKGYFENYTRLLVIYLLDTTAAKGGMDFSGALRLVQEVSGVLAHANQIPVLLAALDERLGRDEQSVQIRRAVADRISSEDVFSETVPCLYLVSNKNTDESLMPGTDYFGRIFADLIALADSPDWNVSASITRYGVKTVGYASEQKPSDDIAKVSVSGLLSEMSHLLNLNAAMASDTEMGEIPDLAGRLGISEDGSFCMLESYIEDASKALSLAEAIEAFPRRTSEDRNLSELTAERVDEETFGSWSCYIESVVDKIGAEIAKKFQQENDFEKKYIEHLNANFSRVELLRLSKNRELIAEVMGKEPVYRGDKKVLDSFRDELAVSVFHNELVNAATVDVVVNAGKKAEEFMNMWNQLADNQTQIVKQADIIPFYRQKVQNYIDQNRIRLCEDFHKISDTESLMRFLKKEIKALIKSDRIFLASFEQELIERMGQKDPATALQSISRRLTGRNVKTWLSSSGAALGDPVQQTIFLETGTELEKTIKQAIKSDAYYIYDTDNGERADALNIYLLDEYQLRV